MQQKTPQAKALNMIDTVKYITISSFYVALSVGIFVLSAQ